MIQEEIDIAIIVVAYNRSEPLKRVLKSLSNAYYPAYLKPQLIISIDYSGDNSCLDIANNFNWNYGEKNIIQHKENLGLKKHILVCGDLSSDYDFIIMLEDDLFVSRYFFDYSVQAYNFYKNNKKIAGFSLYSYYYNDTAKKPFTPISDGNDIYFLQLASSWGQIWTSDQWRKFKQWLSNEYSSDMLSNLMIPEDILNWPETSWKKLFIFYMIYKDLYFVYPRVSLSTNFMDIGVHHKQKSTHLQVPLLENKINYRFININDTDNHYDAFCELSYKAFQKYTRNFIDYEYEVDLYGTKPLDKIKNTYILTGRRSSQILFSFSLSLKPHELNIFYNMQGDGICLADKSTVNDKNYLLHKNTKISYYHNIPFFILNYIENQKMTLQLNAMRAECQTKQLTIDNIYSSKKYKLARIFSMPYVKTKQIIENIRIFK